MQNSASVLAGFHPAVRAWFEGRFGGPSRAQEIGWPLIAQAQGARGHDVLLCAPTGSGKTLAAFMWAIDGLVRDAERGELRDEVAVLYVSPLKALANDIRLNLEEPLAGVREAGHAAGLDLSGIRAGLRTGDTPAHERSAMLRRPPHILVTTPESFFLLLTSPKFREKLASVRLRFRSSVSRSFQRAITSGRLFLACSSPVSGHAGTGPSFSAGSSSVRLSSRLQPSASTS